MSQHAVLGEGDLPHPAGLDEDDRQDVTEAGAVQPATPSPDSRHDLLRQLLTALPFRCGDRPGLLIAPQVAGLEAPVIVGDASPQATLATLDVAADEPGAAQLVGGEVVVGDASERSLDMQLRRASLRMRSACVRRAGIRLGRWSAAVAATVESSPASSAEMMSASNQGTCELCSPTVLREEMSVDTAMMREGPL